MDAVSDDAVAEAVLYSSSALPRDPGLLLDLVSRGTQLLGENVAQFDTAIAQLAKIVRVVGPQPLDRFVIRLLDSALSHIDLQEPTARNLARLARRMPTVKRHLATFATTTASGPVWKALSAVLFDLVDAPPDDDDDDDVAEMHGDFKLVSGDFVDIGGVAVERPLHHTQQVTPTRQDLILLDTAARNLQRLGVALGGRKSILVRGPRGSGKTAVIRYAAQLAGARVVELVLDENADARALLGYHELSQDGAFVWRKGPVALAAKRGDWIVVEDVDRAPLEVLAALKPLARDRWIGTPGRRCGPDFTEAAPGFQLLATTTTDFPQFFDDGSVVDIEAPTSDEIQYLIDAKYPNVSLRNAALKASMGCTLREILKLVDRLSDVSTETGYVDEKRRFLAALDAVDICVAGVRDSDMELAGARKVAAAFEIDPEELITCLRGDSDDEDHRRRRSILKMMNKVDDTFALTPGTRRLLERLSACVQHGEACLLVGEPGCGKTTAVQRLAKAAGKTLVVVNLSHATDAEDLLGGIRPAPLAETAKKLFDDTAQLFETTFPVDKNTAYLAKLQSAFAAGKWATLAKGVANAARTAATVSSSSSRKRKLDDADDLLAGKWTDVAARATSLERRAIGKGPPVAFSFVESALMTAAKTGDWILLDEVNLAPSDVLQRLGPILDKDDDLFHENFRVFGAMNPSGDAGKKELPPAVRGRFTEIFVREPSADADLIAIALGRIGKNGRSAAERHDLAATCVRLHRSLCSLVTESSGEVLVDGAGNAPRYTLRTFCRALDAGRALAPHVAKCGVAGALREGFELAYATQLAGDGRDAAGRGWKTRRQTFPTTLGYVG